MKKQFLLLAIAAFAAASCTKSDVAPSTATATAAATIPISGNFSNSLKAKPVTTPAPAPAAKGGPGGGGGGGNGGGGGGGTTPAPPTNLQVFTTWQTGTWATFIGVAPSQTVDIQVIYNANGTYNLTATSSSTGLLLASNGTWSLTTPAGLPLGEYVLLTLTTSSGKVLMSGVQEFFHPGIAQWTVTTNNLPANLHAAIYGVQKL
jgi:hypothetical protein